MAIGGSIESVTVNGRILPVAADSDSTIKLGGKETEIQSNGDGTARNIQTRMPWSISGIALSIDQDRADLEFLQDVSDAGVDVSITVTLASGVTYAGSGMPTGEVAMSTQNSTAPITFTGPGKLEQQ